MNFVKKAAAVLLSSLCCLVSLHPSIPTEATTDSSPLVVNNLVLFAQFDTGTDPDFMTGYTDDMVKMCNDTSTVFSLAGYIKEISYGQMEANCFFPQMEGDTIVPYTMSQSESSYARKELVVMEVLEHVDIPEDTPLDGNHDGVVDNIILVVDASEDAMGDAFWPCTFSASGMQINGLYSGMVNLQNSKSLFKSLVSGGVGVLCHEFLHTIGYPDLYHATSGTGVPVGLWDVMASNSIYLQYPLAYLRASISGWLDTTDITSSGSYTLAPASADSGNRIYLLKTPLSDTEFFAVEFRQKVETYDDQLDRKIYGTGMVVYRVNTEVDGNHKSAQDEIYVFRPEETTLNAGQGDLFSSNYGGTGRETSIGSLDFSDGIAEGALVYTDGTNSGIQIRNITISGDTLSFDVEFADTGLENLWQSVSNASAYGAGASLDLTASETDGGYLLTSDGTSATVSKLYDDNTVALQGTTLTSSRIYEAQLAVCDGIPYVLYRDKDYRYVLCALQEDTGRWVQKKTGDSIAQYADITAAQGKLYIAYTTGSYPYALHVMCYDPATDQTEALGDVIAENACNISLTCSGSTVAIAYRDLSAQSTPTLAVWNGDDWNVQTLSQRACSTVCATSENDSIYVAVTGDSAGVYCVQDTDVTTFAYPETTGSYFAALPLCVDGRLFVALNTQSADDFSLYEWTEGSWETLGNSIASEVVNSPSIIWQDGKIYVGYFTANGTTLVKFLTVQDRAEAQLSGDSNLDGTVDVADLGLLQTYLVGRTSLTATQKHTCDLNASGTVNVYDLMLLKRYLHEIA